MFYEIKIYNVAQPAQAESINKYLKDAFIPALHKAGISKVEPYTNRTGHCFFR